jgi:tRNA_anti-like
MITSFFLSACNSGDASTGQEKNATENADDSILMPVKPKAVPSDTIKISAVNLVADYVANEVKADYNYKGKLLEVSGVVQDIKKGMADDIFVILNGHRQLRAVQCYLYNNSEEVARNLSQGMKVTFVGECEGLMANVVLKNCMLVKDLK